MASQRADRMRSDIMAPAATAAHHSQTSQPSQGHTLRRLRREGELPAAPCGGGAYSTEAHATTRVARASPDMAACVRLPSAQPSHPAALPAGAPHSPPPRTRRARPPTRLTTTLAAHCHALGAERRAARRCGAPNAEATPSTSDTLSVRRKGGASRGAPQRPPQRADPTLAPHAWPYVPHAAPAGSRGTQMRPRRAPWPPQVPRQGVGRPAQHLCTSRARRAAPPPLPPLRAAHALAPATGRDAPHGCCCV